jgi:hypothetical protein
LAGDEASGWNPLLNRLLHLAEQLEELGIIYAGGQVVFIELEEILSHV